MTILFLSLIGVPACAESTHLPALRTQAGADRQTGVGVVVEMMMIDRLPTEFETKVLKYMNRPDAYRTLAGNKMVAISAACRRLEKLGYVSKPGTVWYVTDKGDKFLTEIACLSDLARSQAAKSAEPLT